ncbi:Tryptophan synthase alpha chain [Labilithrix luteola]|uniref:Tryptophan synthase alpha chain n=2 Tax=Labilithrix luteola TaxID=1391654 RepID=A0A0K1PKL0_9BACT|nr:Tryptophan synthase alpha chain [Labilithrix luteola]
MGGALAFTIAAYAGCANDNGSDIVATLDAGADSSPSGPTFVDPPKDDAGADADGSNETPPELFMCMGTECPTPYATCNKFSGLAFKCETNLLTDDQNCGECGNVCPTGFGGRLMTTHCVAGKCQRECEPDGEVTSADCNGNVDDGCEVHTSSDNQNCGACGVKCPDGVNCHGGKCGCPDGQTDCGLSCVNVSSDNFNCGACGIQCPRIAAPKQPHTQYTCVGGQCNQLTCASGWLDCDGDAADPAGNGCETNARSDANNCGACGKKCGAGQLCLPGDKGAPTCLCEANQTLCGVSPNFICADLQTSLANCGVCGHICPGGFNHGTSTCRKGYCGYECEAGWGDCDDDPANGCETNLMVNGGNCGTCGNRCDVAAGQPCIEGKCFMTACDGGTPVQ